MLLVIIDPNIFLKRPKSARLDVWRLPGLRPRAIVVCGVHRGPFGEQKLCSRDVAVERRVVERRVASGGFFPGSRRPLWASGGTTGKRPMCRAQRPRPWEDDGSGGHAEL